MSLNYSIQMVDAVKAQLQSRKTNQFIAYKVYLLKNTKLLYAPFNHDISGGVIYGSGRYFSTRLSPELTVNEIKFGWIEDGFHVFLKHDDAIGFAKMIGDDGVILQVVCSLSDLIAVGYGFYASGVKFSGAVVTSFQVTTEAFAVAITSIVNSNKWAEVKSQINNIPTATELQKTLGLVKWDKV